MWDKTHLFFFVILSSWHTYYFYHILFAKNRSLAPSQIQRKCIMQMYTFQEMGTLKAFQTLPVMYFPDHHVPGCVLISVHPENASSLPLWRGDLLDPYFSRFFNFISDFCPLTSIHTTVLWFLALNHCSSLLKNIWWFPISWLKISIKNVCILE